MSQVRVLRKTRTTLPSPKFRPFKETTWNLVKGVNLEFVEADLYVYKDWSFGRTETAILNFRRLCYLGQEYRDLRGGSDLEGNKIFLVPSVDTDEVFHALLKTKRGQKICGILLQGVVWDHHEAPEEFASAEEREEWESNREITASLFEHHFDDTNYFDQLERSMRARCRIMIQAA